MYRQPIITHTYTLHYMCHTILYTTLLYTLYSYVHTTIIYVPHYIHIHATVLYAPLPIPILDTPHYCTTLLYAQMLMNQRNSITIIVFYTGS